MKSSFNGKGGAIGLSPRHGERTESLSRDSAMETITKGLRWQETELGVRDIESREANQHMALPTVLIPTFEAPFDFSLSTDGGSSSKALQRRRRRIREGTNKVISE